MKNKLMMSLVVVGLVSNVVYGNEDIEIKGIVGGMVNTTFMNDIYLDDGINGIEMKNDMGSIDYYTTIRMKHSIKYLPNLEIDYQSIKKDGEIDFSSSTGGYYGVEKSKTDIEDIDIVLFYEVLEKGKYPSLEFGVDFKTVNYGNEYINSFGSDIEDIYGNVNKTMLYIGTEYAIYKDVSINSDLKINYEKYSQMIDYSINIDYEYKTDFGINPILEVGYKFKKYDERIINNIVNKLNYSGVNVGVGVKF